MSSISGTIDIVETNFIAKQMIWYNIKDRKPLAYKVGGWDGKKSDRVLVCTFGGEYYVAEMYEGILDGRGFCDFYDERDFEIKNVKFWTEIDSPT